MHNHQQRHLKTNNIISKFAVIVLSLVLLTGLALVPALHIGVNGQVQQQQQQQPQQQNQVGLSQVIKQIAQQVSSANPGTNSTHVYQILVQLAKQTAQTASKDQAIQEIQQISSQIAKYPFGPLSQVLSHFAQQVASGNSNVVQIVQQTVQQKASSGGSKNITQTLSSTAVQEASGGSKNVNQIIRQAAQILANRAGVPVEKVEAVIIQIALQIAQTQGKSFTAQSIVQIATQITQNPNGVLAQAILQFVKQDDGGKTGGTTTIIKQVVKSGGGSSRDGGRSGDGGSTININILIQNIVQQAVINAAKGAKVDVTQIAGQIVKASGDKISLTAAQKAVQRILLALNTKANTDVIPKAMNEIVAATTTDPAVVNTIAN